MLTVIEIIIAGVIVFLIGLPIVIKYNKWKKEEKNDRERNNNGTD